MTWWHKTALGTVPVVGVCVILLGFQISSAVSSIQNNVQSVSGEVVATTQALNEPCPDTQSPMSKCGLIPQTTVVVHNLTPIEGQITQTIGSANDTLRIINRPCGGSTPCGTLADVAKTLNTARLTMGQIEIAANSFDQHQSTFYQQEADLSAETQSTVTDLDKFLKSPDLTDTLHNLNTTSAALASTAQHTDKTMGDIQFEADKYIHPTKKKLGFWGGMGAGFLAVKKYAPIPSIF